MNSPTQNTLSQEEEKRLLSRLNRIEGQVRGIKNMLSQERPYTEVLIQVNAVQAAMHSFTKEMLSHYIHTAVASELGDAAPHITTELTDLIQKALR